ncbi:TIGR03111 family XrtG-associated glycosyltransferase [Anaerosporobacter sp.]|uniref:TIGR03111 family XrtG-associated glycosyltransferase n=1 Tax=Anaerosporobacter sp. TaxID=1872529 RepID=UPI00286EC84D|nr:TIGR03111 family XrtG-associated glycosyltransferase [Anaerosporobacter sp.]
MIKMLSSEIVFWAAWVLIPILMEILPALFGSFILLKKKFLSKKDKELTYFPQITLIIPVYNSSDTLGACLDSIYHSSYPNDKISVILVNNESKDDSFSVFREYQQLRTELSLTWLNAKQGKSRALNMALFNSEGKYIIHIDSDGVLDSEAIMNLVKRFEAHEDIHCMTGSVLTTPELIMKEKKFGKKLLKNAEFYEYCQAFLAGRNFEAELNMIFTLSGAFSSFRKSTILKTRLYNTETVCEDTHITFQTRYLLKKKIDICEDAIFYVDPIDSLSTLYVQRQRWQRGEIEVIHMFPPDKNIVKGFFTNFISRLMAFDHTFAFPRMIWYFALLFLTFLNYPFQYVVISVVSVFVLYILATFINYICICIYLRWNKELMKFYAKRVQYVCILPFFNFIMYWFRLAGIINSIKGARTWSTRSFKEEKAVCKQLIKSDMAFVQNMIKKIKVRIYKDDAKVDDSK